MRARLQTSFPTVLCCSMLLFFAAAPTLAGFELDPAFGTGSMTNSAGDWGDFDNDGDPDYLVTGEVTPEGRMTLLYLNGGQVWANWLHDMPGVSNGSVAWGDCDNDGFLEVLLTGETDGGGRIARVYWRGDNIRFDQYVDLPTGVSNGEAVWGDYDNDGDLDILLTGYDGSNPLSEVYQNNDGSFTPIDAGLQDLSNGTAAWGDYDNDGFLDILISGSITLFDYESHIYHNDQNGGFVLADVVGGRVSSSGAWGDYDNDGDLDILLTGQDEWMNVLSRVLRNDDGDFVHESAASLRGVTNGSVAWGDYDNDGYLDIILTGSTDVFGDLISRVYRNRWRDGSEYHGQFEYMSEFNLPGVSSGSADWGDYDNDDDLDLVLSGAGHLELYENDTADTGTPNTIPNAPTNLSAMVLGHEIAVTWDPATDSETPSVGLSYNISLSSPMADFFTGYRRVVRLGNAEHTSWTFKPEFPLPIVGPYQFRVQAIDAAFAGSNWAEVASFSVGWSHYTTGLPGVKGFADWGDYNNDGNLDILAVGTGLGVNVFHSAVYTNDYPDFDSTPPIELEPVARPAGAWGDYNNDGWLDILLTGYAGSPYNRPMTFLYRNNKNGSFSEVWPLHAIRGIENGSVAWGDYDNDGDLDILLSGKGHHYDHSYIYRNDCIPGTVDFREVNVGLPLLNESTVAWVDYDRDGDLDIFLMGMNQDDGSVCGLWKNKGDDVFEELESPGLPDGLYSGDAEWGDFNNDGFLDVLLTGRTGSGNSSEIYYYDSGLFELSETDLPGLYNSSVAWGDYDNDGHLDFVLTGTPDGMTAVTKLYHNTGDGGPLDREFIEIDTDIPNVHSGSVAFGDFDGEAIMTSNLDILIAGICPGSDRITRVYRNHISNLNDAPSAPGSLTSSMTYQEESGLYKLVMNWGTGSDDQTPTPGLSYNVRVGTQPGGLDIVSPMADLSDGYRRVVRLGNQKRRSCEVLLPVSSCYWSVQTIDGAFVGSPFAPEKFATAVSIPFTPIELNGVKWGTVAWGDCNKDEALDLLVTGRKIYPPPAETVGYVYLNADLVNGGGPSITLDYGEDNGSASWGDFNSDGYLDIFLTRSGQSDERSMILVNDGTTPTPNFTPLPVSQADLPRLDYSEGAWADYDKDGDDDVLIAGYHTTGFISRIYRNDLVNGQRKLTPIDAAIADVDKCSVAFEDFDNDGWPDVFLTGRTSLGGTTGMSLHMNVEGEFGPDILSATGVQDGAVDWGDYDEDGLLDLLIMGDMGGDAVARIYRNQDVLAGNLGNFIELGTGLRNGDAAWGDFDNDGLLDVLLAGENDSGYCQTLIFRNTGGGVFDEFATLVVPLRDSAVAWGDYDNDKDLDLAVSGEDPDHQCRTLVYEVDFNKSINAPPSAPTNLSHTLADENGKVTLSWDIPESDDHTAVEALSYNLWIGTSAEPPFDVCSPMADHLTGYRRIVQFGDIRGAAPGPITWDVFLPKEPAGPYYWGVQAIDGGFAGSQFTNATTSIPRLKFKKTSGALEGVTGSSGSWGDYDNDGDLDVILTGWTGSEAIIQLCRNDGGDIFTEVSTSLPAVAYYGSLAWGDYDGDTDLDLLLTGSPDGAAFQASVYRNDGSDTFTDIGAGLEGVDQSSVAWCDFNNDGDPDILLTGRSGAGYISRIYRNDGGDAFTDIGAGLEGVGYGSVACSDYDNDGDMDVLLTGQTDSDYITRLYRNDYCFRFTAIDPGLPGVHRSAVAWGDYDCDGHQDILLTGRAATGRISEVYHNDGSGNFSDAGVSLPGIEYGAVAWGDTDNDGDLDILLTGRSSEDYCTAMYRNDGAGLFNEIDDGLPEIRSGTVALGDYDDDGDLDILMSGQADTVLVAGVYANEGVPINTPPSAPTKLSAKVAGSYATLSWKAATDAETPAAGLTYNLRVGTTPGGSEICAAMSDASDGCRHVAQPGNAQSRTTWRVALPGEPGDTYYFSVQAVDGSYTGSAFAPERAFSERSRPHLDIQNPSPNPFNPMTTISFDLPGEERVEMAIYDVSGRRVRTLVREKLAAGRHDVVWDGTSDRGARVASGVYFCQVQAGKRREVLRMTMVK